MKQESSRHHPKSQEPFEQPRFNSFVTAQPSPVEDDYAYRIDLGGLASSVKAIFSREFSGDETA